MNDDGCVGASAAAAPKALCAVGASSYAAWAVVPEGDRVAGRSAAGASGVSVLAPGGSTYRSCRGGWPAPGLSGPGLAGPEADVRPARRLPAGSAAITGAVVTEPGV